MAASRIAATALAAGLLLVAALARDGVAADADCNPYFPLPSGARWTYREGPLGGKPRIEKVIQVISVEGEGGRRKVVLEQLVRTPGQPGLAAGRARTVVHCDHGRIGMTVRGLAKGSDGGRTSTGTVTAQIPGLPPADKLVPGYQWSSKSQIDAHDGTLRSHAEGERKSRVEGVETVSVPAGRFADALKIVSVETLRQAGKTRSAQQELVEWYARGVGLIKRETRTRSEGGSATSVEELVGSSLVKPAH